MTLGNNDLMNILHFELPATKISVFINNQCIKENLYKLFFSSLLDCLDSIFQAFLVTWSVSEAGSKYIQKRSSSEKLPKIMRKISYARALLNISVTSFFMEIYAAFQSSSFEELRTAASVIWSVLNTY